MRLSLAQPRPSDLWRRCVRRSGIRRPPTALLVIVICTSCGGSSAAARPPHVQRTYLGLECPHRFPCAHLGIALWLKEPARRVTVELDGRRISLATRSAYEYRRYWQGFVEDTRAERIAGDMNRFVRLKVTVTGAGVMPGAPSS
jgi:hypothetical protein